MDKVGAPFPEAATQAMEGQQQAADDNNDDHMELVLGMEDQVRDLAD